MKNFIALLVISLFVNVLFAQVVTNKDSVLTVEKLQSQSNKALAEKVMYQDSIIKVQTNVIKQKETLIKKLEGSANEHLWGGLEPVFYFWWEFWCLLGIFLYWGYKTYKGVKTDEATPEKFSMSFWWKNNKKRLILSLWTLLLIFVIGRFCFELFAIKPTDWVALILGVTFQVAIEFVFKKIEKSIPIPITSVKA